MRLNEKQYLKIVPKTALLEALNQVTVTVAIAIPPGGTDLNTLTQLMGRGATEVERMALAGAEVGQLHCWLVAGLGGTQIEAIYHFKQRPPSVWPS